METDTVPTRFQPRILATGFQPVRRAWKPTLESVDRHAPPDYGGRHSQKHHSVLIRMPICSAQIVEDSWVLPPLPEL